MLFCSACAMISRLAKGLIAAPSRPADDTPIKPSRDCMRMKSGGLRFCVGALFVVLWAGCYPGEIDSASQTDVVLTFQSICDDFEVKCTLTLTELIVDNDTDTGE